MQTVKMALCWAGAILASAFLSSRLGLNEQTSLTLVAGLSAAAVIHLGRMQTQKRSCK